MCHATRFDPASEAAAYLSGAVSWRADLRPAAIPSWDRAGLEALVSAAMREFDGAARALGFDQRGYGALPWNLAAHGPWVGRRRTNDTIRRVSRRPVPGWEHETFRDYSRPYLERSTRLGGGLFTNYPIASQWREPERAWRHYADREEMVSAAAKFAGWLRAAAQLPSLVRLIARTVSVRGVGSPATRIDLWALAERYSPGAAERRMIAIRRRAREILRPYGLHPSNEAVALALTYGPGTTGKAAVVAAAITMHPYPYEMGHRRKGGLRITYRAAREWLAQHSRTINSADRTVDGVAAFRPGAADVRAYGAVTVERLVAADADRPHKREAISLVEAGSRSYHSWRRNPRHALREAREAWARQDDANAEVTDGDPRLSSDRVCLLVTRADSYAAGNCRAGTEAFAARNGWSRRWYVPAALLAQSGDARALNAARVAARAAAAHA